MQGVQGVCLLCLFAFHVGLLLQWKSAAFVVLLGESAGIRGERAHVRILPHVDMQGSCQRRFGTAAHSSLHQTDMWRPLQVCFPSRW